MIMTFYPDAHPEVTCFDGLIEHYISAGDTWANVFNGVGGGFHLTDDGINNELIVGIMAHSSTDKWDWIRRSILLFDTSVIPALATVNSALLYLYGTDKIDQLVCLPDINVFSSNPASNTGLTISDWATFGATPLATSIAYNDWVNGYQYFTLNADGKAAITKGGITKIALRNANYDVANSPPTWVAGWVISHLKCWQADHGLSTAPKLVIDVTMPLGIGAHSVASQLRYKSSTYSPFVFPDPAGSGFTSADDRHAMIAGWGLVGAVRMALSGTLNAAGALGRKISHSFEGILNLSGALSGIKGFVKKLTATLRFSGSLGSKLLVYLGGTLGLSGSLNRLIRKTLSGILNMTGFQKGGITFYLSLGGTLNFSGALDSLFRFSKLLTGTLNMTGSLGLLIKKGLSGVLSSTGSLGRKISKSLAGALSFVGALSKGLPMFHVSLSGVLNLSGSLNRKIKKALSGSVSFIGSLIQNAIIPLFTGRYRIEVRDSAGNLLDVLKNTYGAKLVEKINEPKFLSFLSPANEAKLADITRASELWVRDIKKNTILVKARLERRDDTRD